MANRTLIGDYGGGDYRIRMSKPGYDVTASIDRERLAFDSSWKDGATIYMIGTKAVSPGSTTVAFPDTLPSIPFVYSWRHISATEMHVGAEGTTDPAYVTYHCIASTTGLTFTGYPYGGSTSYTMGFIVLRSITNG